MLFRIILLFIVFSVSINAQESRDYRLDVGDTIKILVFEEPDMSIDVTVDNSGVITYPYMDALVIRGKTTADLENELVAGLKGRVLINPNISVSVIEYRKFSIGGEVKNPGNYSFEPNLSLRKAVNLAGGLSEWSNGKRFKIVRENKTLGGKATLDTKIYPGDVITVLPRRF